MRLTDTSRCTRGTTQHGNGIAHDLLHGNLGVEKLMHEGRVGAILQQPTHEVGQQILVGSNGRIDAYRWEIRNVREYGRVEELAHSVQALELVCGTGGRKVEHRRDR